MDLKRDIKEDLSVKTSEFNKSPKLDDILTTKIKWYLSYVTHTHTYIYIYIIYIHVCVCVCYISTDETEIEENIMTNF